MKRLAVLTSGGDAPGMNAAIRAVTRTALAAGLEVFGVRQGYSGLIAGDFVAFGPREVGGILARGGTMLGSARCPEMRDEASRPRTSHTGFLAASLRGMSDRFFKGEIALAPTRERTTLSLRVVRTSARGFSRIDIS